MAYLRAIYKDTEEPTPTPVNYDRYGVVRIAGVPFTVVWTVDVMPTNDENFVVTETFDYAYLAQGTSIAMENLEVVGVYTTSNEDSASKGAMTLTCRVGDQYVSVRTVVLRDADGNVITADAYEGKTIDVKGIVDYFSGDYQIKVFSASDIIVK